MSRMKYDMSRNSRSNGLSVKRLALLALLPMMGWAIPGAAHAAPGLLHVKQSVTIAAPPEKLWGIVHSFSDLTWVPAVKTSKATNGNTKGSVRTLDFGGATMTERLVMYSAATRSYEYKVLDTEANRKIAPLTDLDSVITVAQGPNGTSVVTWEGSFRRADQSDHPASGADDATAEKQVNGTFSSGLANLKAKAEAN